MFKIIYVFSLVHVFMKASKGIQLSVITEPDSGLIRHNTMMNYIYFKSGVTWDEAQSICRGIGGGLAKIDSSEVRDQIAALAFDKYQTNIFSSDYWVGLVDVTSTDRVWVSDCSTLNYTANFPDVFKSTELCFRLKASSHIGERVKCTNNEAFMCQINSGIPCEYVPRLTTEVLSVGTNMSSCQQQCTSATSCWAAVKLSPDSCIMLALTGMGVGTFDISSKFCLNVTRNTSSLSPVPNSNAIPNHGCFINATSTTVVPSPTTTSDTTLTPSFTDTSASVLGCIQTAPILTTNFVTVPLTTTQYIYVTQSSAYIETVNVTQTVTETETVNFTITSIDVSYVTVTLTNTETIDVTQTIAITSTISVASSAGDNITLEEAEDIALEIVKNLTINAKQTSAHKRKLTSADDRRTSVHFMGYVGILCVIVPLCLLILADMKTILMDSVLYQFINKMRQETYKIV